jgi:HSP20 family protein
MPPTTLIRRSPLTALPVFPFGNEMGNVRSRLRKYFDEPLLRFLDEPITEEMLPETIGWAPVVDVTETPEEFVFKAEIPGLKKEEVTIAWENDVLTIRGEKIREVNKAENGKKYHVFERSYGAFARSFTVPDKIVAEKISAEMTDGVLTVRVPKAPEAKTASKKIEIKAK